MKSNSILSYIALTILSLFSGAVLAHSGHGGHGAIYASGQPHPVMGSEHLLIVLLAVAGVYLALRLIRQ